MGVYSNGLRQPLGQLALASFNNPGGLEKAGSSTFRVGDNSGVALVGTAGVGGRGVLNSGALEMSNVDLAEEFTGLIVAQRGFQANSRVITSPPTRSCRTWSTSSADPLADRSGGSDRGPVTPSGGRAACLSASFRGLSPG